MRQQIIISALALLTLSGNMAAQAPVQRSQDGKETIESGARSDSTFKAHLVNEEFQVWMDIDFYHNNITIPKQEIFGEVPGYFGARRDTRKWIISDAVVKGKKALLTIINDYGSEDLTAELKLNSDNSYTLTRLDGSVMKIVVNNKWVKIPKEIVFYPK
ncbi:MAG: hypothetical protein K6A82_04645 [Prevotella sp.]|nr:hypothetical protein [Prevotella sp.]